MRVTANNVNLRAGPDLRAEVVSQASEDDILMAGRVKDEWVQIQPPPDVSFWVYGELVKRSEVAVSRLQVRSGRGINYRSVSKLNKGTQLDIRGIKGEWLKIAPPKGSSLWISRKYVEEFVEEPVVKTIVKPVIEKKPVKPVIEKKSEPPVKITTPAKPEATVRDVKGGTWTLPPSLSDKKLVAAKEQGKQVNCFGVLRPAGFVWRRPSKFRLVKHDEHGDAVTICYVLGDKEELEALSGNKIAIYGHEYWVQGVKYPVVYPNRILRAD